MKAIIFGGAGFIGTRLTAALRAADVDVTIADSSEPAKPTENVVFERCDVRRPITIERDEPFDLVYNLAAVHRTPGHAPHEYYETNVRGALNIVNWCEAGGERSLTFTSSIAVYGPTETPKSEQSALVPTSDYGRSKLLAEEIHRTWLQRENGRRLRVVRPAVIFGPGEQGNFTRLASALKRGRFMYAGRRDVIKACGYVSDLVSAIRFAEQLPSEEMTFNFAYPHQYTIEEICRTFHQVAGYPLPRTLPRPALTAAMRTLRVANPQDRGALSAARVAKLTASTNILPTALVDAGYSWPTDLEAGLRDWQAAAGTFV